ncbi:hypothetical protein [Deinococcus sp. S9]|uniref:hypothetical protein n=1 Tax=Deinococcus sp. S9 TaxID=2545754 RepID=UPI0010556C98|nr:hypothetical protein [Deinococcus sp. S9]
MAPDESAVRMITAVPDVNPETLIYNALHFAYHQGYIGRVEVMHAFGAVAAPMSPGQYDVFYRSWAERHGLPARTDI